MEFDATPEWLDQDLVFEFFWRFSAFECALKRAGFVFSDRYDTAHPNWRAFARCIRGRFSEVQASGFQDAVDTMLKLSPRRQVVRGGQLRWVPIQRQTAESDEEFALRLVKTARNNLFHGGKYPDGPIAEVARDRDILKAAVKVLEGYYELYGGGGWLSNAR